MLTLAVFSIELLVQAVVWLVAAGLVYWLLNWAVARIAPPEPFRKIIDVVLVIIVLVICLNAIFLLAGHPFINF